MNCSKCKAVLTEGEGNGFVVEYQDFRGYDSVAPLPNDKSNMVTIVNCPACSHHEELSYAARNAPAPPELPTPEEPAP